MAKGRGELGGSAHGELVAGRQGASTECTPEAVNTLIPFVGKVPLERRLTSLKTDPEGVAQRATVIPRPLFELKRRVGWLVPGGNEPRRWEGWRDIIDVCAANSHGI